MHAAKTSKEINRNPLLARLLSDQNEGMVMYRKLKSLNKEAFEINLLIFHV